MTSLTRRLLQYRARQLCGGMATMCQKIHFLATVGTTMAHRPVEKDDRQPLPRLYHNICSTTLGQVSHDTMGICEHDSITFLGRSSGAMVQDSSKRTRIPHLHSYMKTEKASEETRSIYCAILPLCSPAIKQCQDQKERFRGRGAIIQQPERCAGLAY